MLTRYIGPVAGPVLLGVGGASVVAGIITGAVGFFAGESLVDSCPSRVDCDPALRSDEDEARLLSGVGDGLWIAGAAVMAAGLVLTLVLREGGAPDEDTVAMIRSEQGGVSVMLGGGF